jgi:hypothetical protein
MSTVGSRYQATANEDCEYFMRAVVVAMFGACKSVRMLYLFVAVSVDVQ